MLSRLIFLAVFLVSLVDARATTTLKSSSSWKKATKEDYVERNLKTVQAIYDLTVYPNNVPIATEGVSRVPPGLFSQNAKGRVTPVGKYTSFTESVQHFVSLAPLPPALPARTGIYEAEIVSFVSGCPEIAASVVYLRTGYVDPDTAVHTPGPQDTTLKQVAFWRFDEEGAVIRFEAWIPNLALWTSISSGINYNDRTIQRGTIVQSLCPQIQQRCTGANQQYDSVDDCVRRLSSIPFGDFDEVWANNVVCRIIQLIPTAASPALNCPFVGPDGGGKCVDINYSIAYFDDQDLLGSDKPFYCKEDDWKDYLVHGSDEV
ncbi:uncharacterized protein IWZ02DRAFT_249403 [Phyllosticta citriasiana]|uniref:Uncharacterized protein n=1 Tax=Phyllosticta citriasiana TaxID=595635 RepID=A0ABR1KRB7_9PEZI